MSDPKRTALGEKLCWSFSVYDVQTKHLSLECVLHMHVYMTIKQLSERRLRAFEQEKPD